MRCKWHANGAPYTCVSLNSRRESDKEEEKNGQCTGMRMGSCASSACFAGSYLRLIDFCITQLKAQGSSRTCNESKEEEEKQCLLSAFGFRLSICFLESRSLKHHPNPPHGGIQVFRQKSTCLTQSTLGLNVEQIWSRTQWISGPTKPSHSTEWIWVTNPETRTPKPESCHITQESDKQETVGGNHTVDYGPLIKGQLARTQLTLRPYARATRAGEDELMSFFTLVTGPRRSLSLKLSDTKVYEPWARSPR